MQCPKCLGKMSKVRVEDIVIDRCDNCGGLWFDEGELQKLLAIKGSERVIDTGDPALGKSMNQTGRVECPRCHNPMIKMVVPQQAHIQFESCIVCYGAFFDAGEFTDAKHLTLAERLTDFVRPMRK